MGKTNDQVKEYWDDRAKNSNFNITATTDDVYLRELEMKTFIDVISSVKKKEIRLLDLGCGDGFTTIGVVEKLKNVKAVGVDYSANMIVNANERIKKLDAKTKQRIEFRVGDITKLSEEFKPGIFDVVITSRSLINLTAVKQQYKALEDIHRVLKKGGMYAGIENFIDGNNELNKLRTSLGLSEIPVRWHNLFFEPKEYLRKASKIFKSVRIENFSSAYYYATRVIYSKFCQMKDLKPDYLHEIHQLAVLLPPAGNFSPIKLAVHKK